MWGFSASSSPIFLLDLPDDFFKPLNYHTEDNKKSSLQRSQLCKMNLAFEYFVRSCNHPLSPAGRKKKRAGHLATNFLCIIFKSIHNIYSLMCAFTSEFHALNNNTCTWLFFSALVQILNSYVRSVPSLLTEKNHAQIVRGIYLEKMTLFVGGNQSLSSRCKCYTDSLK